MSARFSPLTALAALPLTLLSGRAEAELPPPEFSVHPNYVVPQRSKIDRTDTDFRAPRVSLDLGGLWTLSPSAQFGLQTGLEHSHYKIFNLGTALPGVPPPLGDAFQLTLSPRLVYSLNEKWTLVTGARFAFAGDPEADAGKAFTYGGFVGLRRQFNEHLALTFGVVAATRQEDTVRALPLLGVDWQISKRWHLGLEGASGQLSYALNEPLKIFLGLSYETREFRFAGNSSIPAGVLRDQSTPISLGLDWTPYPATKVTVQIGSAFGTSYRLRDGHGHTLLDKDAGGAPFVSLGVNFGFGGRKPAAIGTTGRAVPQEQTGGGGGDSELGGPTLQIWEENDSVSGTDKDYSQGSQVAFLGSEYHAGEAPGWLHWFTDLPALGYKVERGRGSITAGQLIFTPENIHTIAPQVGDHPYAGWLYVAPALERRGRTAGGLDVLEEIRLGLGWVGPGALGGEAQNAVHRNFQINQAQGWQNQLHNEPTVDFTYARACRALLAGEREGGAVDFIPHLALVGGTPRTQAVLGGTLRIGVNLPDDFGPTTIQSALPISGGAPQPFGVYLFAAAEGRAVARDTFLDGNLWRPSSHVLSEPLGLETRVGFAVTWHRVDVGFTYARQSREFRGQTLGNHDYGSLWLNWRI